MWPYAVLLLLPFIKERCGFTNGKLYMIPQPGRTKRAMILFWGLLLVMLIFRHDSIGIDLKNYQFIFDFCRQNDWAGALGRSEEIAFSALNKAISLFTDDFMWLRIVVAVICILPHMYTYSTYSTDTTLSISLFVILSNFPMLFSGLRQSIAIALGLVAFEAVRNKKPVVFVGIVLLAMLFHTSAFMLLFMYPLYYVKFSKKTLIFVIPTIAAIMVFNRQIFTIVGSALNVYQDYTSNASSTGAFAMLSLFVLFAVFAYLIPEESSLDPDTLGMRNFLLFSVALQMFAPVHTIAMRMNYYYMVFIPLLIPRIISHRSKKLNQVALISTYVMMAFFVVHFFATASDNNTLEIFPYRFFWEDVSY